VKHVTLRRGARTDTPFAMNEALTAETLSDAQIRKAAAGVGVVGAGLAAPRILALLSNPRVNARDVAALISQEPGLSVRVLRIANSAFYGRSRGISTVEGALQLLGLDAVRGIAAAACMDRTLAGQQANSPIEPRLLVRHSLATAIGARELAMRHCGQQASDAFIGGLLHNLGVVVQLQLDPAGVRAMLAARAEGFTGDVLALESGRIRVGHERCIEVVFLAWSLPEGLVAACCHHHEPAQAPGPFRELASLVHLGACLALASGHTHALEPARQLPSPGAMELLGVGVDEFEELAQALPERVEALQSAL
jgi:HD-like signal output (HDOD) protein